MNAVPFDTLKMAQRLEAAGFPAPQAAGASEALAEALIGADIATKADINSLRTELKGDIASLRSELKGDIASLRTELKTELAAQRSESKGEQASLRSELKSDIELLRRDMTIKLGSFLFVAVGVILAAMRYMPMHP